MSRPDFDPQPELNGDALQLRPLRGDDFDGLYAAGRDPATWAGHPAKSRHLLEVFKGYFGFLLESRTTLVVLDRSSGRIIGCSRYYTAPDRPDSIAIGFTFLNTAYWGGKTNFELKRLMLDHAFEAFPDVWFHIDPSNVRSQKATAKLGAQHVGDATLALSGAAAPWMCFRLTKQAWQEAISRRFGAASGPPDPVRGRADRGTTA